jgi:hypothetical protein
MGRSVRPWFSALAHHKKTFMWDTEAESKDSDLIDMVGRGRCVLKPVLNATQSRM